MSVLTRTFPSRGCKGICSSGRKVKSNQVVPAGWNPFPFSYYAGKYSLFVLRSRKNIEVDFLLAGQTAVLAVEQVAG